MRIIDPLMSMSKQKDMGNTAYLGGWQNYDK